MKSTGFRSREKRASQQTLKAEWGIGRYSEIFLLRNSKVTRRQGTTLQIGAWRKYSPEKYGHIYAAPRLAPLHLSDI
jgi:hypothetical protein